ncbi:unnamed protein product, partial [Iphiclides podalirius]
MFIRQYFSSSGEGDVSTIHYANQRAKLLGDGVYRSGRSAGKLRLLIVNKSFFDWWAAERVRRPTLTGVQMRKPPSIVHSLRRCNVTSSGGVRACGVRRAGRGARGVRAVRGAAGGGRQARARGAWGAGGRRAAMVGRDSRTVSAARDMAPRHE